VAETTVKRLLCRGFRHTGKNIGQVYFYMPPESRNSPLLDNGLTHMHENERTRSSTLEIFSIEFSPSYEGGQMIDSRI
jgi:hypothetical protein